MPTRHDQDGLYRHPRSPYWWATYTDARGRRARRSTGTTDKAKAKVIKAQWELEAQEARQELPPPPPPPVGPTFDKLMLLYLEGPSQEKRSAERDRYSAKQLYPFFSGRELAPLSPADIRLYIAKRKADGVQAGTINRELGLLSAALNWARRDLDWSVPNPAQGRRLKEPEGRVRWITHAEATALVLAARRAPEASHLPDFILLALNTGMRAGEILGLEWRRVDLQAGLIYLEVGDQKNGKLGSVPLNKEARAAILSRSQFRTHYCPTSPWVFAHRDGQRVQSIRRSFTSACRRAGITDFHIHDLRHTCAAWLVQSGVPLAEIRDLLRHSTVQMTERYAHLAPHNIQAAVGKLDTVRHTSGVTLLKKDKEEDNKPAATG